MLRLRVAGNSATHSFASQLDEKLSYDSATKVPMSKRRRRKIHSIYIYIYFLNFLTLIDFFSVDDIHREMEWLKQRLPEGISRKERKKMKP